jgi:hypothetical protein
VALYALVYNLWPQLAASGTMDAGEDSASKPEKSAKHKK